LAFAHAVRNAVDHGVETAEERAAAGKSPRARVEVGVRHERDRIVVSIADDGPGIAWDTIAARSQARGLAHATRADLEEALFFDGISSQERVTTTSGRGVGLRVVRDVIVDLGGSIEIQTASGRGTTFRFILPGSMAAGGSVERQARDQALEHEQPRVDAIVEERGVAEI
jgi:chemotaxis protein histidine kinase CheA